MKPVGRGRGTPVFTNIAGNIGRAGAESESQTLKTPSQPGLGSRWSPCPQGQLEGAPATLRQRFALTGSSAIAPSSGSECAGSPLIGQHPQKLHEARALDRLGRDTDIAFVHRVEHVSPARNTATRRGTFCTVPCLSLDLRGKA
jgi:hypothetical protein